MLVSSVLLHKFVFCCQGWPMVDESIPWAKSLGFDRILVLWPSFWVHILIQSSLVIPPPPHGRSVSSMRCSSQTKSVNSHIEARDHEKQSSEQSRSCKEIWFFLFLIASHFPREHNKSWKIVKQLGCLKIFSTSQLGDQNDSQRFLMAWINLLKQMSLATLSFLLLY